MIVAASVQHPRDSPVDSVSYVKIRVYNVQAVAQLQAEGHAVHYRRVPLSRNRTPAALDLQELHNAFFAAGTDTRNVRYLIVARSAATSTSSSFVAHFLAVCSNALDEFEAAAHAASQSAAGELLAGVASMQLESSPAGHGELNGGNDGGGARSPERLMSGSLLAAGASPPLADPRRHASTGGTTERLANSTISNLCRCVGS